MEGCRKQEAEMKFLLAAINAKYIHSNLAVHSLKAYAAKYKDQIEIGEYTINLTVDRILKDIYRRRPDCIGISCYIWNFSYVRKLLETIPKILPDTEIWLGGPEVSYDSQRLLQEYPCIRGIVLGEGEKAFAGLMEYYQNVVETLESTPGLLYRDRSGKVVRTESPGIMDLSQIPFYYENKKDFENRIIYYESSRGCPFSCSYCLSSIDKKVRFRDLEMVKSELAFFFEQRVPQVKFVDRTFNCKHSHSIGIWEFILKNDNGVTNFHFEISADLLNEEELELLSEMRPGLVQLEIGVQSVNPTTIGEIKRTMDFKRLAEVVERLNSFNNIHLHLDLIAGLPFENYGSFADSFDEVYRLQPEQLQLGFLKVLKGSYMSEQAGEYEITYQSFPPYEVLSTKWLTYGEILKLKSLEEMVEIYYNSGQFVNTMKGLSRYYKSGFRMYEELSCYYEEKGLFDVNHSRLARYEILFDYIVLKHPDQVEEFRNLLLYDLYLRENLKRRPRFAPDPNRCKDKKKSFYLKEENKKRYLFGYEGYNSNQISKMTHIEVFEKEGREVYVLFDYQNRDPLTHNGRAVEIGKGDI